MCGIWGYNLVDEPTSHEGWADLYELFEELAVAMDHRGGHSWGVVQKTNTAEVQIRRGLGKVSEAPTIDIHPLVMGHTRYATVGKINLANSHPFQYGNVLGSHNGGIFNADEVAEKRAIGYNVDSMALIDGINRDDVKGMTGYGAVQWMDMANDHVFLCRMRNGDLEASMVKTACGAKALVWCSDLAYTRLSARSSVTMKRLPRFNEGRIYRVDGDKLRNSGKRIELAASRYKGLTWQKKRDRDEKRQCTVYQNSWDDGYRGFRETWLDREEKKSAPKVQEVGSVLASSILLEKEETGFDEDWLILPSDEAYAFAAAFRKALDEGEDCPLTESLDLAYAWLDKDDSGEMVEVDVSTYSGIDDESGAIVVPIGDWIDGIDFSDD